MSLTINAKAFTADKIGENAVGYAGPANTLSSIDFFQLKRVVAKASALFSGVARSSGKLTRTLTLTGALSPTGTAIVDISVSVPVGSASVDIDSLLNDAGSWLSSASAKATVKLQTINF